MTRAKRGRPSIGATPMTGAERMQRHREQTIKRAQEKLDQTVRLCKEILSEPGGTPVEIILPPFVIEVIKRFQITAPLTTEQIIQGALITWAIEESDNLPPLNQGWHQTAPIDTNATRDQKND
jgi:hypothetical protein